MTAYWPYAAAAVCLLSVVRCAARQHCGLRSLLGGAVCGLGGTGTAGPAGACDRDQSAAEPLYGLLCRGIGPARRDGTADFAAAAVGADTVPIIFLAKAPGIWYTFWENEWNIRRRDSPQGLPEESPGFTETE